MQHPVELQKAPLEESKLTLSETFRSLAAEALAGNNQGFVALVEEKFKAIRKEPSIDISENIHPNSSTGESNRLEEIRIFCKNLPWILAAWLENFKLGEALTILIFSLFLHQTCLPLKDGYFTISSRMHNPKGEDRP